MSSSPSQSPLRNKATATPSRTAARISPFYRDLASPVLPHHRATSRFATAATTTSNPATATNASTSPPPPPLFTLDDRTTADFSPDPTVADLLPPSPTGSHASTPTPSRGPHHQSSFSRSPSSGFRSRSLTPTRSAGGSPVDGVVVAEPAAPLALPPPPQAQSAAPPTPTQREEVVTPVRIRRDSMANGDLDEEEWVTVFG